MASKPITISAATSLTRNVHGNGPVINLASTTGRTLTLPASTGKGDVYRVFIGTTVSSGNHVVAALGTDIIQGAISIATDIAGVTCPTTATTDKITMSGTTTGGVIGSYLELTDVKSGCWLVTGALVSTSTEATPFSET
jgi:hypothetical protein